ncbi:MAG: ATPase, partial [Verrucomicrobia bacterium]
MLDCSLALGGLVTLGLLVLVVGFPLSSELSHTVSVSTRTILAIFAFQELLRFGLAPRPFTLLRSRRLEASIAIIAGFELMLGYVFVGWLGQVMPGISPSNITLLYLGGAQLTLLTSIALRAVRNNQWLSGGALSPGQVLVLSFTGLIILGMLLLQVPHATYDGISWVDSVFLATSAVCVTGLTPLDIPSTLTQHGQWILLGLIQIGGLGIMTLTFFFAYYLAGGVSLRNRIGLQ